MRGKCCLPKQSKHNKNFWRFTVNKFSNFQSTTDSSEEVSEEAATSEVDISLLAEDAEKKKKKKKKVSKSHAEYKLPIKQKTGAEHTFSN